MLSAIWIFASALFILGAACYLLFITSDPLEEVGGRIGKLLHLPEDVVASTFQALATSGPEIVMAILAATPFISDGAWSMLLTGEKASAGCLNMSFSAMDNLLGIGCLGMIFMIKKNYVEGNAVIKVEPSVIVGLLFYIISSTSLCYFLTSSLHTIPHPGDGRSLVVSTMQEFQAWILMGIGILFVVMQFGSNWISPVVGRIFKLTPDEDDDDGEDDDDFVAPTNFIQWLNQLLQSGFVYAFLVFALVLFVRECMAATFNMAMVSAVSVGGILLLFTSYVSSFPEFMMTYRYAVANKKSALLGMLFGSNVIDLAFAGFRSIWLHEPMDIFTTGLKQEFFIYYLWSLPAIAVLVLFGLSTKTFKYKHAYPLVLFYLAYIVSGFILL